MNGGFVRGVSRTMAGLLLVTGLSLAKGSALEWSAEGCHRWAKLADPGTGKPGFTLMPPAQTGVQFTNTLSTAILLGNKNLLNGSGVALGDYDGDGLCDVYLCRLDGDNPLYLKLGGWRFKDVTAGSSSIALFDIDNDGYLDLYIVNYGANSVLKDGGKLDIVSVNGKLTVRGPYANRIKFIGNKMFEFDEPDEFYLNNGDGRFTTHAGKPLAEPYRDQDLSAIFRDMNGDHAPDLFIANDGFTEDRCWINDGSGRFREISPLAIRQLSYSAMGVDFADINRDGHDDFFVVKILSRNHARRLTQQGTIPGAKVGPLNFTHRPQSRRNCLYVARGDGTFAETAYFSGVAASEWSWSSIFLDVDLDGWEDILITNGFEFDTDDLDAQARISRLSNLSVAQKRKTIFLFPPLDTPNVAFRNLGNLRFVEAGAKWGFDDKHDGNGMALGDLDNDGDLDAVVSCLKGQALLYRNNSTTPRVAVRLAGGGKNTESTGGRIRIIGALGQRPQAQEIMSGGRYVSGDQARRTFAARAGRAFTIEVDWRDGTRTTLADAKAGRLYGIRQVSNRSIQPISRVKQPFFTDFSAQLGHEHKGTGQDDFKLQPGLPRSLNRTGPALANGDIDGDGDGDGDKDLIVTGTRLSILLNNGNGVFTESPSSLPIGGTGVVVFGEGQAQRLLHLSEPPTLYTIANGQLRLAFDNVPSCAAAFDADGDEDTDLFIGSGSTAGQFPVSAPPQLFINNGGEFTGVRLGDVGLVSGCAAGDIDGDGDTDLVLACEWVSVKLLLNDGGKFTDASAAWGLAKFTGLWHDVAVADFDGDGKPDIAASNAGRNTAYELYPMPVLLFYGDANGDGVMELVEAFAETKLWKPIRTLEVFSDTFPHVRGTITRNKTFASASLRQIIGPAFGDINSLKITDLSSGALLNKT